MDTSAASPGLQALHRPSGVGVIDKAAAILDALEAGPTSLAQLVAAKLDGIQALLDG